MGQISDAAIEVRAQSLAKQDGFTLELEYGIPQGPYAKPSTTGPEWLPLNDERRKQYLARARDELCREARNKGIVRS